MCLLEQKRDAYSLTISTQGASINENTHQIMQTHSRHRQRRKRTRAGVTTSPLTAATTLFVAKI